MRSLHGVALLSILLLSELHADPPASTNAADQRRAGDPTEMSGIAHPSDTGHYTGYYVGGGSPGLLGKARTGTEGTWGWDYRGFLVPSRVSLQWYHGLFYQGGTGAYKTDGPKVIDHKK